MIVVLFAPIIFIVVAIYTVLTLTAFIIRAVFTPLIWLAKRPPRPPKQYRVELRHYDDGGT